MKISIRVFAYGDVLVPKQQAIVHLLGLQGNASLDQSFIVTTRPVIAGTDPHVEIYVEAAELASADRLVKRSWRVVLFPDVANPDNGEGGAK
jgi:hypothetical protein